MQEIKPATEAIEAKASDACSLGQDYPACAGSSRTAPTQP